MKKNSILLRQVAKGIGLPYKLLAKDLKNIKFSRSAETMLAHDSLIKRIKEKYLTEIIANAFNEAVKKSIVKENKKRSTKRRGK